MSRFKIGNIKGPKGDKGEQGATGPKGEQGIQGPEGPAGGVNSVNGMTGDVTVEDTQGINLFSESIKWESGSFLPESGNLNNNNIRIRMIDYSPISKNVCYTISIFSETDSYEFVLYAYDEQYNFLPRESSLNWLKTLTTTFTNCAYYKIAVRHSDDTVIDVSEINTLVRMKLEPGTVPNPVWTPAPEDVVTKTPYDIFTALDGIPEMHRNLYRGRNLGESTQMSEAHKAAIQDGSFRDLFVGDYWTHDGINYRIADADYFWNCGDKAFTTHHLVIVPDTGLYNAAMDSGNTTEGGYVNSEMRTKNLAEALEMAKEAFPGMVLSHRDYFVNKCTNGKPSGGDWYDSELELMNEIMLYGSKIFSVGNDGVTIPTLYTTANSQLSLFLLNPKFIKTRQAYWLRDAVSAVYFALMDNYSTTYYTNASLSRGVRPYICIGVQASADEAEEDMEVVPMGEPLDTTY